MPLKGVCVCVCARMEQSEKRLLQLNLMPLLPTVIYAVIIIALHAFQRLSSAVVSLKQVHSAQVVRHIHSSSTQVKLNLLDAFNMRCHRICRWGGFPSLPFLSPLGALAAAMLQAK